METDSFLSFIMTPMSTPLPLCSLRFQQLALGERGLFILISPLKFSLRYGIVGLLRPLTVYPSEMVYWFVSNATLPAVVKVKM